ncbi:MAG: cellulase family glycosylhydrolase [Oscillospiraceae bacterium]
MRLRKILSLMLAVVMCVMCMSLTSFAATKNGISLNKTSVSIAIGKSYTLKPTLSGMSKATVQWSSSDKSVATVSKGKVTAKGIGTAKITVKVKDTSYKAECTVKVVRGGKISADLTGAELVSKIKVGINPGGCLEPNNCFWLDDEMDYENAWCTNEPITEKYFTTAKKAGFNAVRIPVSWGDHMDEDGNISKQWLDRVQEVVDYAYDNGMYVILNTHHEDSWLSMEKYDNTTAKKFKNVWTQIAKRFKNYDERLILEGMNEPRTIGTNHEWDVIPKDIENVNKYNQLFVDTVRATGGNNKNRCLMITSACGFTYEDILKDLKIPNNDDKIIVDVHAYTPWGLSLAVDYEETKFDAAAQKAVDGAMWEINEFLVKKGIPVIIGEFGTGNKNNTSERIKHAKYYVSEAKKLGVPCFWWDNHVSDLPAEDVVCNTGLMDRTTCEWYFPELTKAIVDGAK